MSQSLPSRSLTLYLAVVPIMTGVPTSTNPRPPVCMVGAAFLYPAVTNPMPCTRGNVIFGSFGADGTLRQTLTENLRCVSVVKMVCESSSAADRMMDCLRGLLNHYIKTSANSALLHPRSTLPLAALLLHTENPPPPHAQH